MEGEAQDRSAVGQRSPLSPMMRTSPQWPDRRVRQRLAHALCCAERDVQRLRNEWVSSLCAVDPALEIEHTMVLNEELHHSPTRPELGSH